MDYGTQAQKERIAQIIRGELQWCQGYSNRMPVPIWPP